MADCRIDSWKDISAYLGRDVRTVIRWEKERGLPVHRIPGGQRQGVFAFRDELDDWLAGSSRSEDAEPVLTNRDGAMAMSTNPVALTTLEVPSADTRERTAVSWRLLVYGAVGFLVAMAGSVALYQYIWARRLDEAPRLIGPQQLTENGREKQGLVTDGKTLYFGQEQDGWHALTEMPIDGGSTRVLWSPQANVEPVDLSPDHQDLLAMTSVGVERERELWIVPLNSGTPRRLLGIHAHAAVWAPDGKTIAFAQGNNIYLMTANQGNPTKIGSFTALPFALLWSPDGQQLRFMLGDNATGTATRWGEIAGAGMKTITLWSSPFSEEKFSGIDQYGGWTRGTDADTFLVSGHTPSTGRTWAWLVQYRKRWWDPSIGITPLPVAAGNISGMAFIKESSRLLLMSEPQDRTTFIAFDPRTGSFRHLLPGVSGTALDYSRDGKWVAYASRHDNSLWVSRADGNATKQITFSPETVELPRWSPDGRQIAYTSRRPGYPWRIHVLSVESGSIREASDGDDSQGAPTWSPDGRFLAYGNVECEHTHSCAIHRIDLTTGKVQTLPDSEGLFTARWSPDGRSIAALHLEQHQLLLFDIKTGKWHKLADSINGNDLSWSSDSKFLFANIRGADTRIVRIRISDGKQETMLDLKSQTGLNIAENEDLQFSLTPKSELVLHPRIHSEEIYAYDMQLR